MGTAHTRVITPPAFQGLSAGLETPQRSDALPDRLSTSPVNPIPWTFDR